MSFGNNITVIPLDKFGSTLISGTNLDNTNDGFPSNGVGKTTLMNALVYALYDQPISDISKDGMVNNINGKHMEVTIEFKTKGHHYKIKRERKMKAGAAGNNTYLFIDGEDKTKAGKVNEQILEIIGIPYALFVRITVFSASLVSFLDLKTSEQMSFIEELFGVNMLSTKADNMKVIIKGNEQDLQLQKAKIDALEKELERHEHQLGTIENRVLNWSTSHDQVIIDTTKDLNKLMLDIENVNIDPSYYVELRDNRRILDDNLTVRVGIKNNLIGTNTNITNLQRLVKEADKKIENLELEITKLNNHQCPYCSQEFQDTSSKISSNNLEIEQLTNSILMLNTEMDNLYEKIDTIDDELVNIQLTIDELINTPTYQEISQLEQSPILLSQKIEQYEQKLIDLTDEVNPYVELYNEMLSIELEEIDYTKINSLTIEVDHQKFLLKLLTKKDSFIRKAILNKNIPFLNSRLQHYLTILGLSHKIEFTHEMTVNISLIGRILNFGNLSAGQRARVNIALSMSFRDMLQHIHKTVNIWMLDEILDVGLDSVGVQAAAKLIKQKAKEDHNSLYVISHRDECTGMFDNSIMVEMKKGFSYIV